MKITRVIATLAVLPLAASLAACGPSASSGDAKGGEKDSKTVTIGIVDQNPQQKKLQEVAKEKGITINYRAFTDYSQPNPALKQKQIDLNWFQHLAYLADYNLNAGDNLAPVGPTEIFPLGLYSKKYKTVSEIPQGAEIAIPNDSINESRALNVLKTAGLITLKSDTKIPTTQDIDTAKSKVKASPVAAEQTVIQLDSLAGSIVNNTFLGRANLDPNGALAKDDPKDPTAVPYINLFVSRNDDKNNETYKQIVELYHDPRVQKVVSEETKGTSVEAKNPQSQLQSVLDEYTQSLKNTKK